MHVVVGLGNPGKAYEMTRHNVGFLVVEALAKRHHGSFSKGKGQYLQSRIQIDQAPVLLVKPTTFMNLSGVAVRQVLDYYHITDLSRLLLICDDFHLPFGTIRMRPSGSSGGQKGLLSVFDTLNTNQIARLRIGIGNGFRDARSYVLSPFSREEQKHLPLILEWAADAVESFVQEGIEKTMSRFNRNILAD
ncbi:MAG: aminoacyl-tRNA hydrolase [Calditrichaeota bacterium]|nr:MAG: aminoacyl-tRNA hydrolase [Calditrichota bacterium]